MNKEYIECKYIFKRGLKKGTMCNVVNCIIHQIKKSKKPHKLFKPNIKSNIVTVNVNNISDNSHSLRLEKMIKTKISADDNIKQKILDLNTTIDNKTIIMKHFLSLCKLDVNTSEYYKHKSYEDYALNVPWNKYYNINDIVGKMNIKTFIDSIKQEFDLNIYGMENVKNEIINYICKFITNPNSEKNNLALYGNAGVCKTKFIKILSKVLNLPIKIISLGGIKDSSFFLGHNFTYVESNYGVILQSIIDSKIMNPILYFDELDKVSQAEIGKDIYSVLSNLTDSTINSNFSDHYFRGMKFDLSKVFYIFTFNDLTKIDKVLLDRLNVIYVETPSKTERCTILSDYCLKDIITNIGMSNLTFDNECYMHLINYIDKVIDKSVSSGIRESIKILEKILLEINKEMLCKTYTNTDTVISFTRYLEYFNKLKAQFMREHCEPIPNHMYM